MKTIPLAAPDIGESEIDAVLGVLRSGRLSLGPCLPAFEEAMARVAGTTHAVAMNSGTSALHVALLCLRIGPGDEVITPSFSFVASANVILMCGASPVFVEVDPHTWNLDPEAVEAAITPRTRAVLPVHVFGRPAPMEEILEIADRHGLHVVEDACEAIGATLGGRPVGSFGQAAAFAFYPNKMITTGEGGVLVTGDAETAARASRLRNQGRDDERDWFQNVELGYNFRLDEMSCALGLAQVRRLEELMAARDAVAAAYRERLAGRDEIVLPAPPAPGMRISRFVYVIRLHDRFSRKDRDAVAAELAERGIACGRYFAPIHLQPLYRDRGHRPGELPVTEALADRVLALPFHGHLDEKDLDRISEELLRALSRRTPR